MRIFGVSLTTILCALVLLWIGARYPGVVNKIPVVGKIGPVV